MSQFFASGDLSIGVSASASVFPRNLGLIPLGLSGLISLQSRGLSIVFSNTTVWKHQFFGPQSSLWCHFHIWFYRRTKKDLGRKMLRCFGDPEFELMLGIWRHEINRELRLWTVSVCSDGDSMVTWSLEVDKTKRTKDRFFLVLGFFPIFSLFIFNWRIITIFSWLLPYIHMDVPFLKSLPSTSCHIPPL